MTDNRNRYDLSLDQTSDWEYLHHHDDTETSETHRRRRSWRRRKFASIDTKSWDQAKQTISKGKISIEFVFLCLQTTGYPPNNDNSSTFSADGSLWVRNLRSNFISQIYAPLKRIHGGREGVVVCVWPPVDGRSLSVTLVSTELLSNLVTKLDFLKNDDNLSAVKR